MKQKMLALAAISCFALPLFASHTEAFSDWIGVYARIDKVVLEPNDTVPERIQIWGAFALASKENRSDYLPAQRGYLYYSLRQGKEELCRKEWADFKTIAGTGKVIGFGSRGNNGAVRQSTDKPSNPDVYPVSYGLVKMSDRDSGYAPIVQLRSLPKEK